MDGKSKSVRILDAYLNVKWMERKIDRDNLLRRNWWNEMYDFKWEILFLDIKEEYILKRFNFSISFE